VVGFEKVAEIEDFEKRVRSALAEKA